ncbi:MAG: M50 family metallopeptidase [Erysipelotrichaceae bacterium]|jgi:regulator of sigma E protease|nr:M50 family metallopeptidase [Erysipelotrichaceae bacterium]MDO5108554.1 M50 family metallopeptidase [Erysipelotrichaceae bacterium]
MTIIYFLILLSMIIVIHEAGHLLAAKKFGVYCYEFAFGMGPLIWQKKGKETKYSIRAIPIGGYVSMAGEQDGDDLNPDVQVPAGRRLTDKPWWQKIIIMLAGVTMNFLLAWVIFSLSMLAVGGWRAPAKAVVNEVVAGSPAEAAGFMPGDRIVRVTKEDGSSIEPDTYVDMQAFSAGYSGVETYIVERDGEQIELEVTPRYSEEDDAYLIGIVGTSGELVPVTLLNCWYYGAAEMGMIAKLLFTTLAGLLHGHGLSNLSGPVGIYQATETYAAMGFMSFMLLVAQLSLNVGIFNLLPLPVLDGGQIVITLAETIVGRKLNDRIKTGLMLACWVVLIGFMLFVTWQDIARLFG